MHRRLLPIVALATGLLMAGPALASHVQPEVVDGSSSCGPLTPGTVELVVEVPEGLSDTVGDDAFDVDVSLDGSVGNGSIDFANATLPVTSAFVAGATSGHLYTYEEPVTEDDGLVAPDGQPIANVSFCYVSGGDAGGGTGPGATQDTAGGGADDGSSGGGEAGEADAPSTDTLRPTSSPLAPIALVAAGVGLTAVGLVLLLPRRRRT